MELKGKQGIFIGDKIKLLRWQLVMTQKELAQNSGINRSKLSRIENRLVKSFDADFLRGVAHALGVTVNYLLGESEQPVPGVTSPLEDASQALLQGYRRLSTSRKRKLMDFLRFLEQEETGERNRPE